MKEDNGDTDFDFPHLLKMAQGPLFVGRVLRGSNRSICRAMMLCYSTILPDDFQTQKQPLEDYTYWSYAEVRLALSLLPNRNSMKQSAVLISF